MDNQQKQQQPDQYFSLFAYLQKDNSDLYEALIEGLTQIKLQKPNEEVQFLGNFLINRSQEKGK
ncbi:unnamed protein product [Paramecium octaurelia]|uniref:Uncharacterized protein n=1 Tax=Paramecium octaurelia TaxID=43137 RepID=A0A8S1UGV7_PAROT|nr:unnamed protein product [Paramecium octaurelia]